MKKAQIKKSVSALAMAAVIAVSLFGYGCGAKPASTSSDAGVSGNFTGTAKGFGGDVSVTLTLTDAAIDKIADAGFDPVYGARPLRRAIQSRIEDVLAEQLLEGRFRSGDVVQVGVKDNHFSFDAQPVPAEE